MVQLRTHRKVVDNSGVKHARRIQVMRTRKRPGRLGDFIVATVTQCLPDSSRKKGDLVRGYLVTSVYGHRRRQGNWIRFPANALILVNKKGEPLGTRVRVPRPVDLRSRGRTKLRSRAPFRV